MVIAYHLVWTNYGCWLPNDPRGSGSRSVAIPELAQLGPVHYGRKKIQPASKIIREFKTRATDCLQFNVIHFSNEQMDEIAASFADVIAENSYTCYACAIMPDHVHILIRKHKHSAETMIENLQDASRLRFSREYPKFSHHPIWTTNGWRGFIDAPAEICRTVKYIENNPREIGLPMQKWNFVTLYNNWPMHKKSK